jgi:hypothetical protein
MPYLTLLWKIQSTREQKSVLFYWDQSTLPEFVSANKEGSHFDCERDSLGLDKRMPERTMACWKSQSLGRKEQSEKIPVARE